MDEQTNVSTDTQTEDLRTVADLRKEAVDLGFPQEAAEKITARMPLIALVDSLKKKSSDSTPEDKLEDPSAPRINPTEEREITNNWNTKVEVMRKIIMDQIKNKEISNVLIPLSGKETKGVVNWVTNPKTGRTEQVHVSGSIQPFTLNGFQYLVPKGVRVDVPRRIAEELEKKFNQTSEAGENLLIDRVDPETGKAVRDRL